MTFYEIVCRVASVGYPANYLYPLFVVQVADAAVKPRIMKRTKED